MSISSNPPLPVPVTFHVRPQGFLGGTFHYEDMVGAMKLGPTSGAVPSLSHSLQHGCYLAQWRSRNTEGPHFNGVMRIEKHNQGFTASGDLYLRQPLQPTVSPPGITLTSDPSPSAGIPTFARSNYRYYLRVSQVLVTGSSLDTLTLAFTRYSFERTVLPGGSDFYMWKYDNDFTVQMAFKAAPESYRSGATYLEGEIKDSTDTVVGHLTLGWVSKYLRKATLEIDRVPLSEYPADNTAGVDWKEVYDSVDWDVKVYESDTNLVEPSGGSWSDAEMHAAMLDRRDSADLDREWRYYLICVRFIDGGVLGNMYDWLSTDSNNIPREGAGISSHIVFPEGVPKYAPVAGQRMGVTPEYFRTAVHEIGHAMGLQHNNVDHAFMYESSIFPGGYPASIPWTFNPTDASRLRHMPDPWVRPGMLRFNLSYRSAPFRPRDRLDLSDSITLDVKPLMPAVPIGAPVRVRVALRNTTDAPVVVPASLSLKTGNVCGSVVGPGNSRKAFQSIMRCTKEHEHQVLKADAEISHDLTLLRGGEGALFAAPGLHQINVDITWEADKVPLRVRGSAAIMVQPAVTESHAQAALKTLSTPDLLLTLTLGGDRLEAGVEALQAALADETLAPHYAVIEAKRLGRRFRTREANPSAALKVLTSDTVMSPSEVKHMASLLGGVAKNASSVVDAMQKAAVGDKDAEELVASLL